MNVLSSLSFTRIPPGQVFDGITNFSLGPLPESLRDSISNIGMTHPIMLVFKENRYRIVCGNRRAAIARELGVVDIPAFVFPKPVSDEAMLDLNLTENQSCRQYHDLELGLIFSKLKQAGVGDQRILEQYMPRIGLERSKKLLSDYLLGNELDFGLRQILFELQTPLRVFSILFAWDLGSQKQAGMLLSVLRPGVNKIRELLEWVDEASKRDGVLPLEILSCHEVQVALRDEHRRYEQTRNILFKRRFPALSELRDNVWKALGQIPLDPKIKIRTDSSFEREDIRVELSFKSCEELRKQAEQLSSAAKNQALEDLIQVFKHWKK